jgi:hypothetical protein
MRAFLLPDYLSGEPHYDDRTDHELSTVLKMNIDLSVQCLHNYWFRLEGFPSGQRDQTVNLTALPSKVRILPPPPNWEWMLYTEPLKGL